MWTEASVPCLPLAESCLRVIGKWASTSSSVASCMIDQARKSAKCFENFVILIKYEEGDKRDEMAPIKFTESVVTARSPNLSGWVLS